MARSYKNITGSTAVELIGISSDYGSNIKSIALSNVHASDSVDFDLYLYRSKGTGQYIDLSGKWRGGVPVEEVDNTHYSMYIKLSASDSAVDVIVNGEVTEKLRNY